MKLNSEGRIMLNADFIAFAKLDETALYAGIGRSFQVWLPERYRAREAETRARAKKMTACQSLRIGPANRSLMKTEIADVGTGASPICPFE